jgi:hypothetical protein
MPSFVGRVPDRECRVGLRGWLRGRVALRAVAAGGVCGHQVRVALSDKDKDNNKRLCLEGW